jgi:hypothetical protein
VKQRSYGHSIVADSSRGVGLEEAIVAASETGGVRLMLRKRTMPLKNSLPEALSALILVFSNKMGRICGYRSCYRGSLSAV